MDYEHQNYRQLQKLDKDLYVFEEQIAQINDQLKTMNEFIDIYGICSTKYDKIIDYQQQQIDALQKKNAQLCSSINYYCGYLNTEIATLHQILHYWSYY